MLIRYQAYANIAGKRLQGDVLKENTHTVLMKFHPPPEIVKHYLQELKIVPTPFIAKRHKRKHRVSVLQ